MRGIYSKHKGQCAASHTCHYCSCYRALLAYPPIPRFLFHEKDNVSKLTIQTFILLHEGKFFSLCKLWSWRITEGLLKRKWAVSFLIICHLDRERSQERREPETTLNPFLPDHGSDKLMGKQGTCSFVMVLLAHLWWDAGDGGKEMADGPGYTLAITKEAGPLMESSARPQYIILQYDWMRALSVNIKSSFYLSRKIQSSI